MHRDGSLHTLAYQPMTRRTCLLELAASLLAVACRQASEPQPPNIRYGRDVCAQCGMIISDARFAAAAQTAAGEATIFDDIGCLLTYRAKYQPGWQIYWVHDYDSQQWLRAELAVFIISQYLHSPMGYGIAAFARESSATAWLHEWPGEVVSWDALLARPLQQHQQH